MFKKTNALRRELQPYSTKRVCTYTIGIVRTRRNVKKKLFFMVSYLKQFYDRNLKFLKSNYILLFYSAYDSTSPQARK